MSRSVISLAAMFVTALLVAGTRAAIKSELAQIEKLFKDLGQVKEKDVIDIDFAPDGATTVTYQKQLKGTIPSVNLQRALLKIWLGPKPVQSDLKEALLNGK